MLFNMRQYVLRTFKNDAELTSSPAQIMIKSFELPHSNRHCIAFKQAMFNRLNILFAIYDEILNTWYQRIRLVTTPNVGLLVCPRQKSFESPKGESSHRAQRCPENNG